VILSDLICKLVRFRPCLREVSVAIDAFEDFVGIGKRSLSLYIGDRKSMAERASIIS